MTSNPKTIVFLTRSLNAGGAERLLSVMAKGLVEKNHEVHMISFYTGGLFSADLEEQGVKFWSVNKRSRWDVIGFLWRLIRILKFIKPDAVYSFLPVPNIVMIFLRPFLARVKIIWGIGALNNIQQFHDKLSRLTLKTEAILSRFADIIVVNSKPVKRAAIDRGLPENKMRLVRNGVELDLFCPDEVSGEKVRSEWTIPKDTVLIGRVGRISPVKGYETFIEAASIIAAQSEMYRFVIVGVGEDNYHRKIQNLAIEAGVNDKIIWAGVRDDMLGVYNAMDFMISSSVEESSPHVVIEAMSCGTLCVATNAGDSELLLNETGRLVEINKPEQMAEAILELSQCTKKELKEFSAKARKSIVERYSVEKLIFSIEELIVEDTAVSGNRK